MLTNISMTVPQLIVEFTDHGGHINKKFREHLKHHLSTSYLFDKYQQIAIVHSNINSTLLDIYLSHAQNKDSRQAEYMYPVDADHFTELHKTEAVCHELYKLTMDLLTIISFTDDLNQKQFWTPGYCMEENIEPLLTNPRIRPYLEPHLLFINNILNIASAINRFSIGFPKDLLLLEDEPVIHSRHTGTTAPGAVPLPLRQIIEEYNQFFRMTKIALRQLATDAYLFRIEEIAADTCLLQTIIPQIPAEKRTKYGDPNFMFHLYHSPYYGRLGLKLKDFNERHFFINRLLREIFMLHAKEKTFMHGGINYSLKSDHTRILFATENFIYWIRKNIDELIGFKYCLHYLQTKGREPKELIISSIGSLLHEPAGATLKKQFRQHLSCLKRINKISNTYKHSFVNSETHYLIGKNEPTVNCLEMPWNSTEKEPIFHSYFLKDIVQDYWSFFCHVRSAIQTFQWPVDKTPLMEQKAAQS